MRVPVTSAVGLIGREVMRHLTAQQVEVRGVFASSREVYGEPKRLPVVEEDPISGFGGSSGSSDE